MAGKVGGCEVVVGLDWGGWVSGAVFLTELRETRTLRSCSPSFFHSAATARNLSAGLSPGAAAMRSCMKSTHAVRNDLGMRGSWRGALMLVRPNFLRRRRRARLALRICQTVWPLIHSSRATTLASRFLLAMSSYFYGEAGYNGQLLSLLASEGEGGYQARSHLASWLERDRQIAD